MIAFLKSVMIIFALLLLVIIPRFGIAAENEILYKICFPRSEAAITSNDECKDEDCGLQEEKREQAAPSVKKDLQYTLLGATDYGTIWGSNNFRIIGDDRVRALLYVIPTVTTKTTYYDAGYSSVPDQVIQTVFFSSFGEYAVSSVTMSYNVRKKVGQRKEISGGEGVLQMIDLHCSARKMKRYENTTLFYRMSPQQDNKDQCVELLWEKPQGILPWQPTSSLTMDLLTGFYCKTGK